MEICILLILQLIGKQSYIHLLPLGHFFTRLRLPQHQGIFIHQATSRAIVFNLECPPPSFSITRVTTRLFRTLLKTKSHNIYAGTVQGKQNVCMATLTTSIASLSLDVRCDFKDVFLGTSTLFWPSSYFPCPHSRKLLFHTLGYIWTCSHMCFCSFSKQLVA